MKSTTEELRTEIKHCLYHQRLSKYFLAFTKSIASDELVFFTHQVDDFRLIEDENTRKEKCNEIIELFLRDDSKYGLHADAVYKQALESQVASGKIPPTAFDDIAESVLVLMQSDIYPKFVKSSFFAEYEEENSKINPRDLEFQKAISGAPRGLDAVSYTHLTLPTICSV
eukprot:TRINITY_DN6394_c0_g1_i2.p1 TRINITY_DN6394_c0_g1~~TRINITY_DN6394_c0_g1_i2.p1  ORF type:complete len:170 (-),score=30.45 TRINITY_DN6394_c0_g1_i2:15-524(-)